MEKTTSADKTTRSLAVGSKCSAQENSIQQWQLSRPPSLSSVSSRRRVLHLSQLTTRTKKRRQSQCRHVGAVKALRQSMKAAKALQAVHPISEACDTMTTPISPGATAIDCELGTITLQHTPAWWLYKTWMEILWAWDRCQSSPTNNSSWHIEGKVGFSRHPKEPGYLYTEGRHRGAVFW